jgi:hypothetical protein
MEHYTAEDIQSAFEKLPPLIQEAVSSPEIKSTLNEIGERNDLHIDQIGVLVDKVGLVMLGLLPAAKFVSELAKDAEISGAVASKIVTDINSEILSKIRLSIQAMPDEGVPDDLSETAAQVTSSFEKVGDLSVEKPMATEPQVPADLENHDSILDGIENPQSGNEKISRKEGHEYLEPMIDHLLSTPSAQPIIKKGSPLFSTELPKSQQSQPQTPAKAPAQTPPAPSEPPVPRSGPDPYRESV